MRQARRGPYAKLFGSFWRHPRTKKLSAAAKGLHADALSYAADATSDGIVPKYMVIAFSKGAPEVESWIEELERVGVWIPNDEGWEIRDWQDANPLTAEEWEARKEKERAKKREQRAKPVSGVVPRDIPKEVPGGPSEAGGRRQEVKRQEAGGGETPVRAQARDESASHHEWAEALKVFDDTWFECRGIRFGLHDRERGTRVHIWAKAMGLKLKRTWQDVLKQAVRNAANDPYVVGLANPLPHFAKAPGGYFEPRKPQAKGIAQPAPHDAFHDDDPDEVWREFDAKAR